MAVINPNTKRVVGGGSFIDSIIRTNANTEEYVKYIISIANKKLLNNKWILAYMNEVLNVKILCNGRELLCIKKSDVEIFRRVDVLAFDKFVLEMIGFYGYNFSKDSEYYNKPLTTK